MIPSPPPRSAVPPLCFEGLPAVPQVDVLRRVADHLWQRQAGIVAMWVGGSLADGTADAYSDIDLRIAVDPATFESWKRPDFGAILPVRAQGHLPRHASGSDVVLHHLVLDDGEMLDLSVTPATRECPEGSIHVLSCRDDGFAARLATFARPTAPEHRPAQGEEIARVIADFWVNSHKHRKVLNRGLDLLTLRGLHYEQAILTRLWYASLTGLDAGERRPTIFELSHMCRVVQEALRDRAMQIMGPPLARRELIVAHIEQLRNEVADVGRQLSARLKFEYPEALEQTVRRGWDDYLATAARSEQPLARS